MALDYKLAKQLKEAGFPQWQAISGNYFVGKTVFEAKKPIPKGDNIIYIPSLSELIKACGNVVLMVMRDNCVVISKEAWDYEKDFWSDNFDKKGKGKTPEEAVAKLWLKLHEKD